MAPRQGQPLQTWKTFLRNHAEGIASIDLFVVPTVAFEQLFGFLVLGHGRRRLIWSAVTAHPTAEERFGHVIAHPILGGLHHRYARI
jgi:hypothetical protein